jgi:hypothetical protein
MKILLDGDHLTYRAAASCSPTKNKPYQEDLSAALFRVEAMLSQVFLDLNSQDYEFYISGEGNWRKAIYPEYKANRKDTIKPLHLEDVREHVVLKYGAEIINDMEVDDMCGIRLTQEDGNAICASLDKDMQTVPGWHYSWEIRGVSSTGKEWVKPASKVLISPLQAMRKFYGMVITGDQADHIPAFDGKFRNSVPLFVQKLLDPLEEMTDELEMWKYSSSLYADISIAERNAKVLYIQKKEEDFWQIPGHPVE